MKRRALTVFVSYRRSDVSGYAGRITDALGAALGRANVFQDVATIVPGVDFPEEVDGWLARSDALLAIIGPGWLGALTAEGERRLFQADDLVRMEVAHGLRSDVRVVPVLVGGAALPSAAELPQDLKELATRQAITLRDDTFHQDVERLLRSLRGEPSLAPQGLRGRRARLGVAAGLVALALAAGGSAWWYVQNQRDDGSNADPGGCPSTSGTDWHDIDVVADRTVDLSDGTAGSLAFSARSARWRPATDGQWLVVLDTQMLNNTNDSHAHAYYYYENLRVARHPFKVYCFDKPSTDAGKQEAVDARVGFYVTCQPVGLMEVVLQNEQVDSEVLAFTSSTEPAECQAASPAG
ncbi:toll/interleukin-1 receptor domain-containing protein [Angustibacter sp. McL0619]|uniref:toll/interleukin-1 receptor domain-containing protein n=1 Tax=Angustibacter sp. McL0619 TaxID=3415676 RepID=UPI003CFA9DAC